MRFHHLSRAAALAVAGSLFIGTTPAAAQLQLAAYGAGEWDLEDMSIYVLGAALQTTNNGWGPAANVLGYLVDLPPGEARESVTAINPSAGLQYRRDASALQLRVGYTFITDETTVLLDPGAPVFGGAQSGVTTTAQYNHWGSGRTSFEAIANMNWGDQYLWARARASQRMVDLSPGSGLNLGAEGVVQGNDDYRAYQAGGLLEFAMPFGTLIGGVGYKFQDTYDDTPYFRAEFVIVR